MDSYELTDRQWETIKPFLPPQRSGRGRPADDHRRIINGILWKLTVGGPWRQMPGRYGPWSTVHTRLRRWRMAGIWDRIFERLLAQADADGRLDWGVHFVDASVVRAHQHAAGAKRGTSRTTRRSGAATAGSRPRSTSGSRAEAGRW
jgi:transposase